MDAISPQDADRIINYHCRPLPAERIAFNEAYGRILREPVLADRDFPPYNRVMMDGIAIRHADWKCPALVSRGIQRAGIAAQVLDEPNSCFEVMTGAVLPMGADTIVPVEDVEESEGQFSLRPGYEPLKGQFIHKQGSDNREGDLLMASGTWLGAKESAVLATCGYVQVSVTRTPRVTIVSTGDELVAVDETPNTFQIRKSNVYALEAACQGLPTPVKVTLDHLPDDRSVIADRINGLIENSDILLFSGGISKGKYDFLQELLVDAGATKHFQWVQQRPGKPLWFGTSESGTVIFALPGNPNSTLTCFVRYVVNSINIMAGIEKKEVGQALLKSPFSFQPPLTCFLPVTASWSKKGPLEVKPLPAQNSGDLARLILTDGFIELPGDQNEFPVGFSAPFYSW